ncbi:MAG: hypothetical protein A2149_04465 [Candidatus Schekmanbacteria bacterium RBG_16_38_11]|uniref:Uncharacterized protein n=1 Tax=Candidatus Schekmanbacteria bacterium RBG_16_38_11 TaxID=1817880 RepID=A0A1F7S343_9BACT|nr:MAG: hypothetical protein A2149_04465 [Candidatus Schekmanbacteria bacterium RBG_16_38_11]
MPCPVDGDECSDLKPIDGTFPACRQAGCPVLHFRRGWKASAIREAPSCGRGASLSRKSFISEESATKVFF